MNLLLTSETKAKIAEEVSNAQEQLQIVSAFCKISAVEFIDSNLQHAIANKKLLVRFTLSDILQGASDLGVYAYCKEHGWQMYVRFDLHAKTYIFDRKRCILGSANLTGRGLGIGRASNYELSSLSDIDESEVVKVDMLFANALKMTDEIFEEMERQYSLAKSSPIESVAAIEWSQSIQEKYKPEIDTLFTYDFPSTASPDLCHLAPTDFLDVQGEIRSLNDLRNAFRGSKAFLWLYKFLLECPDQTSYFGAITAALHDVLLNDPKPYRKEVKELLANLLSWIEKLEINNVLIDRPNYSQRVRINKDSLI